MELSSRQKIIVVTVAVIWCIFAVFHVAWVTQDQSPPLWDMAGHSVRTAVLADSLAHGHLLAPLIEDSVYPPVAYIVAAPGLWLGWSDNIPQLSLLLWSLLLLAALILLGSKLFDSVWVGLGAFILMQGYPLWLHFSRIFDLDYPQAVIITTVIAAAVASDKFTNRGWSLTTGILLAVALLTKFTAGLFLIGPLAWLAAQALLDRDSQDRALKYGSWATLLAGSLAAPWYILHGDEVLLSSEAAGFNTWSIPTQDLLSIQNFTYYFNLIVAGLSWPLLAAAVVGAIILFWKRAHIKWRQTSLLMLLWLFIPYLLLTFLFSAKEARYILPLLPAIALITSGGIWQLSKLWRAVGGLVIGLIALTWFVVTGFGWINLPSKTEKTLRLDHTYGLQTITPKQPGYGFTFPTKNHYNLTDVSNFIKDDLDHSEAGQKISIAVIPNSIYLTSQQVQWYALLVGLGRSDDRTIDYSLSSQIRFENWQQLLPKSDYIVAKSGDQGPAVWGQNLKEISDIESAAADGQVGTMFDEYTLVYETLVIGIEKEARSVRIWRRRNK